MFATIEAYHIAEDQDLSDQLHPLQARMPVLADDDVIVHRYPERTGDVDDGAGHLDIGL